VPLITDIKPQKNKKRFNIYLDGKFAFGLSAEARLKAGLKIDQEISSQKVEELIKEDEFIKFYDRALKFLSYRPRSERELQDWFKKKKVGSETQKLIEKKLKHLNYLDDEEFTRWWIEQRTTFRPFGKRRLALELRQKGIDKNLIVKLLDCYLAQDKELELAEEVAKKKLKNLKNLPYLEARGKLSAFLARRGFGWEIIKEVVAKTLKKE
jgi:regulatory protein